MTNILFLFLISIFSFKSYADYLGCSPSKMEELNAYGSTIRALCDSYNSPPTPENPEYEFNSS